MKAADLRPLVARLNLPQPIEPWWSEGDRAKLTVLNHSGALVVLAIACEQSIYVGERLPTAVAEALSAVHTIPGARTAAGFDAVIDRHYPRDPETGDRVRPAPRPPVDFANIGKAAVVEVLVMTAPAMTKAEAAQVLAREMTRLRSGEGGHGGRSPEALRIANAIEALASAIPDPASRPSVDSLRQHIIECAQSGVISTRSAAGLLTRLEPGPAPAAARPATSPPRLHDLLTPTDPDVIGWSPGEVLYAEPEIRAKATHAIPLLPSHPPSVLDPYRAQPPRGLLAVLETPGSDLVSFVVVEWVSGPGDDGFMPALYQPLFHGEGPSGTLRELRHTHWGHADDGYLHEPNGALIAAAFEALKRWFDCWRRT